MDDYDGRIKWSETFHSDEMKGLSKVNGEYDDL